MDLRQGITRDVRKAKDAVIADLEKQLSDKDQRIRDILVTINAQEAMLKTTDGLMASAISDYRMLQEKNKDLEYEIATVKSHLPGYEIVQGKIQDLRKSYQNLKCDQLDLMDETNKLPENLKKEFSQLEDEIEEQEEKSTDLIDVNKRLGKVNENRSKLNENLILENYDLKARHADYIRSLAAEICHYRNELDILLGN